VGNRCGNEYEQSGKHDQLKKDADVINLPTCTLKIVLAMPLKACAATLESCLPRVPVSKARRGLVIGRHIAMQGRVHEHACMPQGPPRPPPTCSRAFLAFLALLRNAAKS
jgi:hypothetical protein